MPLRDLLRPLEDVLLDRGGYICRGNLYKDRGAMKDAEQMYLRALAEYGKPRVLSIGSLRYEI